MARKRDEEEEGLSKQVKSKGVTVEELEESQGALAEDPKDQQAVLKKNSKRRKKGQDSNPEGTRREKELNANSSRKAKEPRPKSIQNDHSQSSSKGEDLGLKSSRNGHFWNPESSLEGSKDGHQLNSKSSRKGQDVTSQSSIQVAQELTDAEHNNEETLKVSMDMTDKKKKKNKKKRDRWGQALDDAGNTHDTSNDGMEAGILDNTDYAPDAANEDMDGCLHTVAEHDSHEMEYDNKTVVAGGMPYDTTEEDILELFMECGTVARVICMKFADSQRFKGLAFITFETEAAASKALSLDGANMGDRHIKIEKARAGGKVLRAPPRRESGSLSVYVGNLDWGVQKIDIKRFFKGCDIDNVRLAVDKYTGDFRGYGHVDFSDEKSLEKAIKMDKKQLLGRPVKVSYAVPKGFKGKAGSMN